MDTYGWNASYLTKNEKPWFPVMGEIHYSRYDKRYWKEALDKMKAGGVSVASTYVIWIHHEEIQGGYDFSGNRDLREFVACCQESGLSLFLRIGPWVHAEVRNGGFPDWMLQKEFKVRTNEEAYFNEVKKYWQVLYQEVKEYLYEAGGCIIGIQIENEYGHCGGMQGDAGEWHMQRLTEIAREVGFHTPLTTATGWGGAVTGGLLPVMGGYCDAPWDQRLTEIEPSGNYIFTTERNDHNIGSDHGFGHGITFDINKFPYLTAELGGGQQVTHHRRPIATASDIGAMSLVKLGSGCNLLGYYMYHGGTNPEGKLTTLQESTATGDLNDYPELSYDFRAPIREYGQIGDTWKELKLLTTFVAEFGEELCLMDVLIPTDNPLYPSNVTDLRYAYRHHNNQGYLFVSNYQRRIALASHQRDFVLSLVDEVIKFPRMDIKDKDYFFYPFNFPVGKAVLKTAMATPLCKINQDIVFYADHDPQYQIEGELEIALLTISKEQAKNSYKIKLDQDYLILSDALVLETKQGIMVYGGTTILLKAYPTLPSIPKGYQRLGDDGVFAVYERILSSEIAEVFFHPSKETKESVVYQVDLLVPSGIQDCFLKVMYQGDRADLLLDGKKLSDDFYTGEGWEIGLKQFGLPKRIEIIVYPLQKGDPIYLEAWPELLEGRACRIDWITASLEYQTTLEVAYA